MVTASEIVVPTVSSFGIETLLLIVVVPLVAPMFKLVAEFAKFTSTALEIIRLKLVEDVVIELRMFGLFWNTRRSVPVVSVIRVRNCVDVVGSNVARVSDVYATLPPCLKLTVIDALLLSDVSTRSLLTSSFLEEAISSSADAV